MQDLILLLARHSVLVVFLVTFAGRVGAPLPAAPLLVMAGGLIAMGQIGWVGVLLASLAANLLGDAVWFYAGRRYGHRVLRLLCKVSFSPDSCARQSESLIAKWGGSSLVAAKFLPGISVVAAPMAGAIGMSVRRFVAFDLLAAACWTALFVGLGMAFNQQISGVLSVIANAGGVATLVLLVGLLGFVASRWWRRYQFNKSVAMHRVTVEHLRNAMGGSQPPLVIDVRTASGLLADPRRVPGSVVINLHDMKAAASDLPQDREIVLYCNCPNDVSAARGAGILLSLGFQDVHPLEGGLDAWIAAGLPVSTQPLEAAEASNGMGLATAG
ncbi:MAG: Rhodanese domain protein [Rhizobacter sp.]|nr:Rhodanese domain protein [Rhizobacter sp.]